MAKKFAGKINTAKIIKKTDSTVAVFLKLK